MQADEEKLFLLVRQHALGTLDALSQTVLELSIAFPISDVLGDGGADNLRDWLVIHRRHGLQLLGLIGRQANRHRFSGFHDPILPPKITGCQVSNNSGIMVSEGRNP